MASLRTCVRGTCNIAMYMHIKDALNLWRADHGNASDEPDELTVIVFLRT